MLIEFKTKNNKIPFHSLAIGEVFQLEDELYEKSNYYIRTMDGKNNDGYKVNAVRLLTGEFICLLDKTYVTRCNAALVIE